MNLKNKRLVIAVRVIFGLLLIFSGISGLLGGPNAEGIPAAMQPIVQAYWDTGIFQMIKVTEVVAGLMLVVNFLPALAVIFVAPIAIGIIIFNAMLLPAYVISGIIVALFEAYFGYVYWDKYKTLFQ